MSDWLTVADVAAYLDLPGDVSGDDNLSLSVSTVKSAVERRRGDLDFTDDTTVPDEVRGGAVMWSALVYQTRNAPSGFAGYGDETVLFDTLGTRRAEIMRLIGWRRPLAY